MSARLLTPAGSIELFAVVDSVAVIVCNGPVTADVVTVVFVITVAVPGVSVVADCVGGGGGLEAIRVVVFSDVVDVVSIDVVVCDVDEVAVFVVDDVVISAVAGALLFHSWRLNVSTISTLLFNSSLQWLCNTRRNIVYHSRMVF
jgi:hypothetical protein